MLHFSEKLYHQTTAGLRQISIEAENPLQRAVRSYRIIEKALCELKGFIQQYVFKDDDEKIHFFKVIKPMFMKELIFFDELFYIEANKPIATNEVQKSYLLSQINCIMVFFERNQSFYNYYLTGNTDKDTIYFLTLSNSITQEPSYGLDMDPSFSLPYSRKLSKILAYEMLREYLQKLIFTLEFGPVKSNDDFPNPPLIWTDTKVGLAELCYGLYASGSINNGKASITEIVGSVEAMFGIDLGNFYRMFQDMLIRKKEEAPFLDRIKKSFVNYLSEKQ